MYPSWRTTRTVLANHTLEGVPTWEKQAPFFPRNYLVQVAKLGPKWNFNRQLHEPVKVPEGTFSVARSLVHNHRHGVKCETHIRCLITLNGEEGCCDVPLDFYRNLPRKQTKRPTKFIGGR